jgi:peptidoglycan hydrolase-like protein with peptidoglycan-binding domain
MSTTTDAATPVDHSTNGRVDLYDDQPASSTNTNTSRRRGRRRGLLAVLGVAAVGVATVGIVVATSGGGDDAVDEPVTIRTATAETVDLVEFTDIDGTLSYAATTTVTASADGLVTEVATVDDLLEQGAVAYATDGRPAVVLYGDVPLYRELTIDAEGDDVLLLEQNLSALGYHVAELDDDGFPVDEDLVVDGIYDDATAEAVERWQDDLGVEPTGVVLPTDVVVLAGPSEVTEAIVAVGDRLTPGAPVLNLNQTATVTAGPSTVTGGEVELFVTDGQRFRARSTSSRKAIETGAVVYSIDDAPFTAIVTNAVIDRDLENGVEPGDDVRAIEKMLVALGYDAGGDLVVDVVFDDATEAAIEDWQEDLANTFDAVDVNGRIDPDDLVVVAPGTTVGAVGITADDTVVATGTQLWTTTTETTERIVTTSIPVADQDQMPLGGEVTIALPDGEQLTGVVTSVASTSNVDPTDPNAVPEFAVEITLASVPESVADIDELDVEVKLVDEMATGVTAVPASALVAVGDGTYAVEVVNGDTTQFVAVVPGMFNDGLVEVDGIAVGTVVVVA